MGTLLAQVIQGKISFVFINNSTYIRPTDSISFVYIYIYIDFDPVYESVCDPVTVVYLIRLVQTLKSEFTFVVRGHFGYDDCPGTGARSAVCGAGQETAPGETPLFTYWSPGAYNPGRFDVNPRFKSGQSRPAVVRPCTRVRR